MPWGEIVVSGAANAHWRGFPGYWSDIYSAQAKERMREGGGDHCSEDYKKAGCQIGGNPLLDDSPSVRTDERLGREAGREGGLSKGQVNSLEASKVDNRGWTNVRIAKEAGQ